MDILYSGNVRKLTKNSKSENDELKREVESLKAPSTAADNDKPGSHTEGFSESFTTSMQLAKANSTQRYGDWNVLHGSSDWRYSDEYWKLYENYTGTLKRVAEISDLLESTKKDLSNAQVESKKSSIRAADT